MQKLRLEMEADARGLLSSSRELRTFSDASKAGAPSDPAYDKMGENESAKDQVRTSDWALGLGLCAELTRWACALPLLRVF